MNVRAIERPHHRISLNAAARPAWRVAFWLAFAALVAVRVPSLAQPAGGDQGLYWYIGQRIAHGEIPYRDAWDQKPPGIHFMYAAMTRIWPHESVVPGADLVVATAIALLLVAIGRHASRTPGAGGTAALLFLALGNPVVTRLGGVRVRAQCETFIALAVTAAVFLLRDRLAEYRQASQSSGRLSFFLAGLAVGVAVVFKYNAAVYLAVPVGVWLLDDSRSRRHGMVALAAGAAIPVASMVVFFAAHGAWRELIDATVSYNLQYSGETYAGAGAFLRYLFTFPYRFAWLDSLWLLGGVGCAILIAAAFWSPRLAIGPLWVAAACLSIAINGSRDLQQYFVQAGPALAFSAAVAASLIWSRLQLVGRAILIVLVSTAVWRVTNLPKGVEYTMYDWRGLRGQIAREAYLSRFGAEDSDDKYAALAVDRLAAYLEAHTDPEDLVFVFGFSGGAYAQAQRRSASRFFWSRPVIVEFNRGKPGYGPEGLLTELSARAPACVVLQWRDWPDTVDSATYFHRTAMLENWLRSNYNPSERLGNYEIWLQKSANSRR